MSFKIAIDGPAGAGKSTIAKRLAKKLGFLYIDTGAMYRAISLYFLRNHIPLNEEERISNACKEVDVSIVYKNEEQQVLLNKENVNAFIRTEQVGAAASITSSYVQVRKKLVELQQKLAEQENVVMDGRDIGTCVLPDAQVKIYLTASVEIRGKRRFDELTQKGVPCSLEEICKDIQERDYRDMNRENSPLCQAKDAILIDSTYQTINEAVEEILEYINAIFRFA
ncbi:(d)CMP kinase [Lachnospiraceae bacterium ZAX-1]